MKPALVRDEINFECDMESIYISKNIDQPVRFYPQLSDEVQGFIIQQNYNLTLIQKAFSSSNFKGYVLFFSEGFVSLKNKETSLVDEIVKISKQKIVLVVLRQIFKNQIQENEQIQFLIQNKVIFNTGILFETALVKLSFLLGNYPTKKIIRKKLQENIRGEFFLEKTKQLYSHHSNFFTYFCNQLKYNKLICTREINTRIISSIVTHLLAEKLLNLLKQLIEQKFDLHVKNQEGVYPVLELCKTANKEYLSELWEIGVDFE